MLKNSKLNNVERNNTDEFSIQHRSLGRLVEMVVGHDNSGMFASWHLEQIEVQDCTTGVVSRAPGLRHGW